MVSVDRVFQALVIVSTVGFSWLAMMAVHEFGHVLHLWFSGGKVARVVLHPLEFSRTDVAHNPRPLFVTWGGAVWGCVLQLAVWGGTCIVVKPSAWLAKFFAGFCLIANGVYLACSSFIDAGDAGDLVRHGAAQWHLLVFGLPAAAAGLYLWNGLGPHFGLGAARGKVDRKAAIGAAVALLVLATAEALFG